MGDHAQDAFDRAMDESNDLHAYHIGSLTAQEAYDRGIINELGQEDSLRAVTWGGPFYPGSQPKKPAGVTCRNCGKTGLAWMKSDEGAWRVAENNQLHNCHKSLADTAEPLSDNQYAQDLETISDILPLNNPGARAALLRLAKEIARLESEVMILTPLHSKREIQAELQRVRDAVPATYYADCELPWRVAKIVSDLNRANTILRDVDETANNLRKQVTLLTGENRSLERERDLYKRLATDEGKLADKNAMEVLNAECLMQIALEFIPRGTRADMKIRQHLARK